MDTQQNTENTTQSFMDTLIQEVVSDESNSEILKLRADNDEIDSFLRTLTPSSEKEMIAFETLSNVQAENIKRIAFLYTLNFNKTNSNIRENVEI